MNEMNCEGIAVFTVPKDWQYYIQQNESKKKKL